MDMKSKDDSKIQWHQAFVGAIHCELGRDQEKLDFYQEHSITKKPLQVDLLIIKKTADGEFSSGIGRLLSRYNILEYKSPGDSLGIDALFQALTYASYYKSSGDHENERKDSEITVMLVRNEYPQSLVKYLTEKGCAVTESEPGVFQISGQTFFRIIILATGRMDQKEHVWLNALRNDLKKNEYYHLLERSREIAAAEGDYVDVLLSVVEKSNAEHEKWKEESNVASLLIEAIKNGEQRGITIGEQRGITIGERRGEQKRAIMIAGRMLHDKKLSVDEIMAYTGITRDEIAELERGMKGEAP